MMPQTNFPRSKDHQPAPRPRMKRVGTENGVPVFRCESVADMCVRLEHLRRPGDQRSAERIIGPSEMVFRSYRNRAGHRVQE